MMSLECNQDMIQVERIRMCHIDILKEENN